MEGIHPIKRGRFTVAKDATTKDVVSWMKRIIPHAINDPTIKAIAYILRNDPKKLEKTFRAASLAAKYKADDPSIQTIRTPLNLLNGKIGNCVDYSIFQSAILSRMGVPHKMRLISQLANSPYTHIYIVTDSGKVLDPIYGKDYKKDEQRINRYFNKEMPRASHKDVRIL